MPLDDVAPQIQQYLIQETQARNLDDYVESLREDANIAVLETGQEAETDVEDSGDQE